MKRLMTGIMLVSLFSLTPVARAEATCADANHPGGEWRTYGGEPANTRNQPAETKINPTTVGNIAPAWVFNAATAQPGAAGASSTPVVADGCVYLADRAGYVFALNADDGQLAWKAGRLPGASQSLYASLITGSPTVANGLVYVAVSRENSNSHSYVAALDQATGAIVWTSRIPMYAPDGKVLTGHTAIATPVVYGDILLQAIAAPEGGANARGGWAVLDATREGNGAILAQDYSVSDLEWNAGYRGASVWCTPALDVDTGYAYACGGNPANKDRESRNSNALLKIDLRRTVNAAPNPTFGKLVDAYKGDVDQYYPGLDRQPVCDLFGNTLAVIWSQACLQLDLDFGASPNLFTDSNGSKILGDLQKSGIYHAVFAEHMQRNWTAVVAPPCFFCNSSSGAVDGGKVYTIGSPPGQVIALTKDKGRTQWALPVGQGTHYQAASTANGVVYTVDNAGFLIAADAATGLLLRRQPIMVDAGASVVDLSSQGVAIARNAVFASAGSFVVAYR